MMQKESWMKRGKPELEVETAPTDLEAQAGPEIRAAGTVEWASASPRFQVAAEGMARLAATAAGWAAEIAKPANEFSSRFDPILRRASV